MAEFYGVRLLEAYTGTVTLKRSAFVQYHDIANGRLNQTPDNQLTVSTIMNWTGGAINTGVTPDFLSISETAIGTIKPKNGQSVFTGDSIFVWGNVNQPQRGKLIQDGGTLVVSTGRQIIVNAFAEMIMTSSILAVPPNAPPVPPAPTAANITFSGTTDVPKTARVLNKKDGKITISRAENSTAMSNYVRTIEGTV